jgi:hypothetical protein
MSIAARVGSKEEIDEDGEGASPAAKGADATSTVADGESKELDTDVFEVRGVVEAIGGIADVAAELGVESLAAGFD